jgi:curli biogenesis system outer membrane secretion channel CsgG
MAGSATAIRMSGCAGKAACLPKATMTSPATFSAHVSMRTLGLLAAAALAGCATPPYTAPQADASPTARSLKALPKRADRAVVTVIEVRSNVGAVDPRAATDMFKTALVQSRQFRVVERQRLQEGALREKQLNAQGMSSGSSARRTLTGAEYVFEASVSEANASENQRSGGIAVAGMQIGGGSNRDSISLDVRIVAVGSGEIVDAVRVLKPMSSDQASVSGVGNLLGTWLARKGRDTTYAPDLNLEQQRREGVDSALRAAIDEAVVQLGRRFAP